MRIGLLQCDHVSRELMGIDGDYGDMFYRLLAVDPTIELVTYDVAHGVLPDDPAECDGYVCTGSRHSVRDEEPWITELERLVRDIADEGLPYVGICFGHQMLAHALGGWVERAASGWGVGVHEVRVAEHRPWMTPATDTVRLSFMHQDQVVGVPNGGEVLASAEHCPVAVLQVGGSMVGFQAHPEFSPAYAAALIRARRSRLGDAVADEALASLAVPTDDTVVAHWMAAALRTAEPA